jgi:type IV secretory pathway protease TraF
MLKRVLALPGQTVCRNGLSIAVDGIDVGELANATGEAVHFQSGTDAKSLPMAMSLS